jgi:hypothetical protein
VLPSGGASSSHYHRTGQEAAWSNLRRGKMRQYRCYLLNTHGSVVKREVFDSDEDEQSEAERYDAPHKKRKLPRIRALGFASLRPCICDTQGNARQLTFD